MAVAETEPKVEIPETKIKVESENPLEIQTSILNYLTGATILLPGNQLAKFVEKSGYGGVQYVPTRHPLWQVIGDRNRKLADIMKSLHGSWREEENLKDVIKHPTNKPLAAISFFLLAKYKISIDRLAEIQKALHRKLPIVVYPIQSTEDTLKFREIFADVTYQPTPEDFKRWNISTEGKSSQEIAKALKMAYKEHGFDHICFDTQKMQTFGLPIDILINELKDDITEIHVRFGEDDKLHKVNSKEELLDMLNGTRNSRLPEILEKFGELGYNGKVIVELPAFDLLKARGLSRLTYKKFSEDHELLVKRIQELLQKKRNRI